jgi:hypothetical protein
MHFWRTNCWNASGAWSNLFVMNKLILCVVFLAGFYNLAMAETVLIQATQDNTLYESPSGLFSNGSGNHLFAGRTLEQLNRRAVIAFKELDAIPAGATISSAKLHLHLSRVNSPPATYTLYRLTSDWGEGLSQASEAEGQGTNSENGDATWAHTFWPNRPWRTLGGDFAATSSADLNIDLIGDYTFGSTVDMASDVQLWLDQPPQNYGWILIGDESEFTKSARRFDSRENDNADNRPVLEVQYTVTGSSFDFSGPWFDPSLDGEGYLVFQTPAGWLIYYFGYSADSNFLWLISDLVKLEQLISGVPFELSMFIGKPGSFDAPSNELTEYGTLSVTFDTCTTGQFNLDGLDGKKTSNVIKIIGVDGTNCE